MANRIHGRNPPFTSLLLACLLMGGCGQHALVATAPAEEPSAVQTAPGAAAEVAGRDGNKSLGEFEHAEFHLGGGGGANRDYPPSMYIWADGLCLAEIDLGGWRSCRMMFVDRSAETMALAERLASSPALSRLLKGPPVNQSRVGSTAVLRVSMGGTMRKVGWDGNIRSIVSDGQYRDQPAGLLWGAWLSPDGPSDDADQFVRDWNQVRSIFAHAYTAVRSGPGDPALLAEARARLDEPQRHAVERPPGNPNPAVLAFVRTLDDNASWDRAVAVLLWEDGLISATDQRVWVSSRDDLPVRGGLLKQGYGVLSATVTARIFAKARRSPIFARSAVFAVDAGRRPALMALRESGETRVALWDEDRLAPRTSIAGIDLGVWSGEWDALSLFLQEAPLMPLTDEVLYANAPSPLLEKVQQRLRAEGFNEAGAMPEDAFQWLIEQHNR